MASQCSSWWTLQSPLWSCNTHCDVSEQQIHHYNPNAPFDGLWNTVQLNSTMLMHNICVGMLSCIQITVKLRRQFFALENKSRIFTSINHSERLGKVSQDHLWKLSHLFCLFIFLFILSSVCVCVCSVQPISLMMYNWTINLRNSYSFNKEVFFCNAVERKKLYKFILS